jgi:hypothetical protein
MSHDPLNDVEDQPLHITSEVIEALREFRASHKLALLPGSKAADERSRLVPLLDALADELLAGVAQTPSKMWVLKQFQPNLEHVQGEDTEAREHFGAELGRVMDILGIESSDGLLSFYLGGL